MDVMIEAAPIAAEATLESVFVAISGSPVLLVAPSQRGAASVTRSLRNTIIARGPNYILSEGLALAAA